MKFTLHKLKSLNSIWNYMDMVRIDLQHSYRAMPSIIAEVRKKFQEKEANRTYTLIQKKDFDITLKPSEACFLEIYIREILDHLPYGATRACALDVANQINQKLA